MKSELANRFRNPNGRLVDVAHFLGSHKRQRALDGQAPSLLAVFP